MCANHFCRFCFVCQETIWICHQRGPRYDGANFVITKCFFRAQPCTYQTHKELLHCVFFLDINAIEKVDPSSKTMGSIQMGSFHPILHLKWMNQFLKTLPLLMLRVTYVVQAWSSVMHIFIIHCPKDGCLLKFAIQAIAN